ncbi:hypothetical protein [Mycobacterium intracellulare]|uniref:Uncharacterized protein n=2 Tax=Mycobacterium intracellulare TaxID=1767 RepID=A0A7R7MQS9_MYCIT|nr:hypothetical protein [Mycobacterium intracellulare]AFC42290.1 hypothetical protein OCU_10710 [Mycobacterium intracellulare ATCC 13950]MEE3800858.1 hypothetical protein [Mycobacterium intracellulare]OBG13035.1 hypothetical protein A5769_22040 [Mycobacterium intracellulare]PBA32328.1 hypothetical protein CKJ65_05970 [Mycobacterium intracellulare]UQB86432.1 hypothetical protein KN249_20525 [Mycobacterium intracellulare]
MNRERHQDDNPHDITVPSPAEAQHDGEITCKGYGPPPPIDDEDGDGNEGDEETSSPKEIR